MCWKVKKQTGEPWVSCFFFQRSYLPTRVLLLLWRPQLPFLPLCLGRLLSGTSAPPASWAFSCLRPLDLWVPPGLALCSAKPTVHLQTFFRSLLNAASQRGLLWPAALTLSVFLSFSFFYLIYPPKGKVNSLRTGTLSCSLLCPQDWEQCLAYHKRTINTYGMKVWIIY